MSKDFFQTVLSSRIGGRLWDQSPELEKYIDRYWGIGRSQLELEGVDLESLFTFLEYHTQRLTEDDATTVVNANLQAKNMLVEYMDHFDGFLTDSMKQFAMIAMTQRATVMTFNYDSILERSFEWNSDFREPILQRRTPDDWIRYPDNTLAFGPYNWNRALAYGVQFDELELEVDGMPQWCGREYYDARMLYEPPLLKLHGSVSWLRYYPLHSWLRGKNSPEFPEQLASRLLIRHRLVNRSVPQFHNGWMLDPVMITPVTLKERHYRSSLFRNIWTQAEAALRDCDELIIIGYSFPPTDFNIRNLLRYVFGGRKLPSLAVVNPCDDAERAAVEATGFTGDVRRFQDLGEFVQQVQRALAPT